MGGVRKRPAPTGHGDQEREGGQDALERIDLRKLEERPSRRWSEFRTCTIVGTHGVSFVIHPWQ